jgi:hypothetical protein
VAVVGGRQAMRKGSPLIWPAEVTVRFLPAIPTRGVSLDERDRVIAQVRAAISNSLAER